VFFFDNVVEYASRTVLFLAEYKPSRFPKQPFEPTTLEYEFIESLTFTTRAALLYQVVILIIMSNVHRAELLETERDARSRTIDVKTLLFSTTRN
jgi:hypothetical protein